MLSLVLDMLSHDVNNHVYGAMGYLDLLEQMDGPDPVKTRFISNARSESLEVSHLVEAIRTIVDARETPFVPERIDLHRAVSIASDQARRRFPEKELRLKALFGSGDGSVIADRFLMDLLTELISNSLDHSKEAWAEVCVESFDDGDSVRIDVSDRSGGFPPEVRQRSLERFRLLIEKEDHHGSGIGLSLVHEVAGRYGGSVLVMDRDVDDGKAGTKVSVTIPRRDGGKP